jgi:hypothetical protein
MMSAALRMLSMLAALFLVAACATSQPAHERPSEAPSEESVVAGLLAQYAKWQGAASELQRKALSAAQVDVERTPTLEARVRLALLYSLPRVSWRDETRVVSLLAGLQDPQASSPLRDLGNLLHTQASERLRQQRSDQRRFEAQLRDDQNQLDELKSKLDALRKIDRDVINKKRPAR